MIKIVGSIFIIIATTRIGFLYADNYKNSLKCITDFINILNRLRHEINFAKTPLERAIPNCLYGIEDSTRDYVNQHISEGSSPIKLGLNKDEQYVLDLFFGSLGKASIEIETANIDKTISALQIYKEQATQNAAKYTKLCGSLGIICGIFIVILFI